MRSTCVKVADVLIEHGAQVSLPEDDDVVETLAADATQEAFACGVHERCSDRGLEHANAHAFGDAVELATNTSCRFLAVTLGLDLHRLPVRRLRSDTERSLAPPELDHYLATTGGPHRQDPLWQCGSVCWRQVRGWAL